MDKVIIDGVDVSECSYFNKEKGFCKLGFKPETPPYCEQFTCYYKQLKRKEQECEKLKWLIETKCESELDKENSELKAENERLKKQYNCYACDSCGGKEDYINMKRHTENAIKTVHKYSQALQEIRDIVSEQCQQCLVIDGFTKPDDCGICDYKSILAKVNEVIGAEE